MTTIPWSGRVQYTNVLCSNQKFIERVNCEIVRRRQTDKHPKKMGNSMPTTYDPNGAAFNHQPRTSTLGGRSTKSRKSESVRPESSRVLFLLYLIHRTWNIMVDTVDIKNKRYVINTIWCTKMFSQSVRLRHTHTHTNKWRNDATNLPICLNIC